jgi:Iap family predicted aminopeptidase
MPSLSKGAETIWATAIPQEQAFWQDFDKVYFLDFAERLSQIGTYELGFRPSGTRAGHRATDLIEDEMQALGLARVRREPFPVYAWEFAGASVDVGGETLPASSYPPSPGTPEKGLRRTLVDAGYGTAADYIGLGMRDKVAFVRFDTGRLPWVGTLAYEAELQGAVAVVFYYVNGYAQHESGQALNTHDGTARPTIPVLSLSQADGMRLAKRLVDNGPFPVTLHSQVTADPRGTGYNVIGEIPGRLKEHYLIVAAHYDAWFHGYWDNAIGVAGILAMAKVLLENDHRPQHTLLFIATDAEEFGAPDTNFDWLVGCHRMLQSHPEWYGRVSAAFNIDTLAFLAQDKLGFIAPPELVPFLEEAVGHYQAKTFPQQRVWVKEQVTAWTETLSYAYFGIPPLQPRFALKEARQTIYHTQFDTPEIVHPARATETVQLYGTLLLRLDQQPILPYDFTERVRSLEKTVVTTPSSQPEENIAQLKAKLALFNELTGKLHRLTHDPDWLKHASERAREEVNDTLCQIVGRMVSRVNYISADAPEDALPLHTFYDRDLRALDAALAYLTAGKGREAIAALTDPEAGLCGAAYATELSYPAYYRHTIAASNPTRDDLFWGYQRTAKITDIWAELHTLQDRIDRGIDDFRPEVYILEAKRERVAAAYQQAIAQLTREIEEVIGLLRNMNSRLQLEQNPEQEPMVRSMERT